MSDLEGAAKPYLTSLFNGFGRELHRNGQTVLAAWAVKTALALHLTFDNSDVRVPAHHYRDMARLWFEPPGHMVVWCAAYQGTRQAMFSEQGLEITREDGSKLDGYQMTVLIGPCVFQAFGWPLRDAPEVDRNPAAILQIWPIDGTVNWPPQFVVDESTLDQFVRAFQRKR